MGEKLVGPEIFPYEMGTAILVNQILGGPDIEGRYIYKFQKS
jgi:hypothetical protein